MFTVVMMPIIVALLMLPVTAQLTVLKAEQKRLDEEVRLMLLQLGYKRVEIEFREPEHVE